MKRPLPVLAVPALTLALLLAACAPAGPSGGESASPSPAPTVQGGVTVSATPAPGGSGEAYAKIDAETAKSMLDGGGAYVLVDVRRADEYTSAHIPGAVNIPNEDIGTEQPALLPDLDAAVIVYCRTGVRSKAAADKLVDMGYTQVYDMGGIVDWPYDTVAGSEPGGSAPAATPTPGQDATAPAGPAPTPAPSESSAPAEAGSTGGSGILGTFTATDLDGNDADGSLWAGHDLTMLNVWATYCGPCQVEMPELGELNGEYADKGFQVVGLVVDVLNRDGSMNQDQVDTAKALVDSLGASYTHLLPSQDLIDLGLLGAPAVPATLFVDKDGNLVGEVYYGARDKAGWIEVIDPLLAEVQN